MNREILWLLVPIPECKKLFTVHTLYKLVKITLVFMKVSLYNRIQEENYMKTLLIADDNEQILDV